MSPATSKNITRRGALRHTAIMAAGAVTVGPAIAGPLELDPAFEAIERHTAASAEYSRTASISGKIFDRDTAFAEAAASTAAAQKADLAAERHLCEIPATTVAGVAAILAYLAERAATDCPAHGAIEGCETEDQADAVLFTRIAAALGRVVQS